MPFPINRVISQKITPLLAYLRLSPNAVTLLCLASGLVSAWFFKQGGPRCWLIGALWLQLAYLLDNCDGELARMTGKSSGLGSWLDTISDCIIHAAFFLCLALGIYRYDPNPLWIRLGYFAVGGVVLSYLTYVLEQIQLRGRSALLHPDPPIDQARTFWGQLRKVFREDFSVIVLASALAHQVTWLLWSGILGSFFIGFSSVFAITVRGGSMLRRARNL